MRLSDFDYNLPKDLIAQFPSEKRRDARLLVASRSDDSIQHRSICDVKDYLCPGDMLVFNDTKVVNARLRGRILRSNRDIELFLLGNEGRGRYSVLIRPLSKVKIGDEVVFGDSALRATIISSRAVEFNSPDEDEIYGHGEVPLPPYIKRPPEELDVQRYQTVFASKRGAVAAPTAGLHFDNDMLSSFKSGGVAVEFITLHVGIGTFRPVRKEDIALHVMEHERFDCSASLCGRILKTRASGGRVFAVGTTTVRALETIAASNYLNLNGQTGIFIYPGFKFKCVDCLITNFHLPRTTLLMLAAAFAGTDFILRCYSEAVKERYRFYSYGDAMLII